MSDGSATITDTASPRVAELEQTLERERAARREVEHELAIFRSGVNNARTGVSRLDADGSHLEANEAYAAMLATQPSGLIGRDWRATVHPDDLPVAIAAWERAVREGESGFQARAIRLDGTQFVERVRLVRIRDQAGNHIAHHCFMRDVTDQVAAEEELRESERRYRDLFERSIDAIAITRSDGAILGANQAALDFFACESEEQLKSMNAFDFYPNREERRAMIPILEQEGYLREHEIRIRDLAGVTKKAVLNAVVMREEAGQQVVQSILRDITEQRKLEEQLRQSHKMEAVGMLAGGIAHDFNNHLTAMIGHAELVREAMHPEDPLARELEHIANAGERAADLTRQLLAFSRQQMLRPRVIELGEVIEETEKLLLRTLGEHIHLSLYLADDLGRVKVDPVQLEQVIINLAVNARDAMPEGGVLTLTATNAELTSSDGDGTFEIKPGSYVMISVTDTGVGMEEATRRRIFEPFFTTKDTGRGTGLGLATVYGIVKQSDGYIWSESAPELGSTFRVCFPCVTTPLSHDEESSSGEYVPPSPAVGSILVVEDNDLVRTMVTRALRSQGYSVREAVDSAEALEVFDDTAADLDLLLTDLVLPGLSGQDLAQRATVMRPELKVMFMSGYTDVRARGLLEPGAVFMSKPFTPKQLTSRVREVLDSA